MGWAACHFATILKGKRMPEISFDPQKIKQSNSLFHDLIWQIFRGINPEKAYSTKWYADNGISDKIQELWELINETL